MVLRGWPGKGATSMRSRGGEGARVEMRDGGSIEWGKRREWEGIITRAKRREEICFVSTVVGKLHPTW